MASERWRREYLVLAMAPPTALLLLLLPMGFTNDLGLLIAIVFFVIINFTMQPAFVTLVAD